MKYIIGLFISLVGFHLASQHLNQSIGEFWDYVAFFVVMLGTFSVLLITLPSVSPVVLVRFFARKFFIPSASVKNHAEICLRFIREKKEVDAKGAIELQILNSSLELLSLGFSQDRTMTILSQRFEIYSTRINMLSTWLKRGAKYPPAFGLAGTVLGLIHLMRGISTGINTKETGVRMAVALVATFYGLLISNLVLNPLGEWLREELKKDELKAEMTLNTVSLIIEGASLVEAHETLNSYLSDTEKLILDYSGILAQEVA